MRPPELTYSVVQFAKIMPSFLTECHEITGRGIISQWRWRRGVAHRQHWHRHRHHQRTWVVVAVGAAAVVAMRTCGSNPTTALCSWCPLPW